MTQNPTPAPGGAARFQIDIEKFFQIEYWTNRYLCNVADMDAAEALARQIVAIERSVHFGNISFTKAAIRTMAVGDGIYRTVPINEQGTKAGAQGVMPLFVVARVDLGVGSGRPSRKYLRGVLDEAEVDTFTIGAASRNAFQQNYTAPLQALAGLCDPQGQQILSVTLNPNVAMRQLRRGSKKKLTQ